MMSPGEAAAVASRMVAKSASPRSSTYLISTNTGSAI